MSSLRRSPEKIRLPLGFSFSAVAAGIKASGRPDLALAEVSEGATAAALFTTNRVVAAPVEVGRASLLSTAGRVRAVIVNSGNANCATGRAGIQTCARVCGRVGKLFGVRGEEIFPSSTGNLYWSSIAGRENIRQAAGAHPARSASQRGVLSFMMSSTTRTATRAKIASARFQTCNGNEVTLLGIAKGAGMIHPHMATMLVYVFSQCGRQFARVTRASARGLPDHSLNSISIRRRHFDSLYTGCRWRAARAERG